MKSANYIKAFTIALTAALSSTSLAAPIGRYYEVPVTTYERAEKTPNSFSYPRDFTDNNSTSSSVAKLIVTRNDFGTTIIQLMVSSNDTIAGFKLDKSAVPEEAWLPFGEGESLYVTNDKSYTPSGTQTLIYDLLTPEGKQWGLQFHFIDASQKPIGNALVAHYTRTDYNSTPTLVKKFLLDADGIYTVPDKIISSNRSHSSYSNDLFDFTDPDSGTKVRGSNVNTFGLNSSLDNKPVPFLADWNTSNPDVQIYSGQFKKANGEPAGSIDFNIAPPGVGISRGQFANNFAFASGKDGRFQVAINTKNLTRFSGAPATVDSWFQYDESGHTADSRIKPGVPAEIIIRDRTTVTVEILDEQNKPIDLRKALSLMKGKRFNSDIVLFEQQEEQGMPKTETPLQLAESGNQLTPVALSLPGKFTVRIPGYTYHQVEIKPGESKATFKPQLKPFRITGRIETPDGKPVDSAIVVFSDSSTANLNSFGNDGEDRYEDLKKLLDETQGKFDDLRAYMTRTDKDGQFTVEGNSLPKFARFIVAAPDGGMISYNPFFNYRTLLKQEDLPMSGDHVLTTTVLAKSATVKFTVPKDPNRNFPPAFERKGNLHASISSGDTPTTSSRKDDYLRNEPRWTPSIKSVANDQWSITVPADTRCHLQINPPFSKTYQVTLDSPLSPGEERDITELLKSTSPATPDRSQSH